MKKSALAITLASLLSPVSYLQAQETSVDETIVVTANRFKQIDGAVLAQTVTVTKEDIRRQQADSLFDVFRTLPISTNFQSTLLNVSTTFAAHAHLSMAQRRFPA